MDWCPDIGTDRALAVFFASASNGPIAATAAPAAEIIPDCFSTSRRDHLFFAITYILTLGLLSLGLRLHRIPSDLAIFTYVQRAAHIVAFIVPLKLQVIGHPVI
jgi:hypothetical protein